MANGMRITRDRAPRKRTGMDVIDRLAGFGSQMASFAESSKQNKRQHFDRYAQALTSGFQNEENNANLSSMLNKLETFYKARGYDRDLETRDLYNVVKDRINLKKKENTDYNTGLQSWENYSNRTEDIVENLYLYSKADTVDDGVTKQTLRTNDVNFQNALNNKFEGAQATEIKNRIKYIQAGADEEEQYKRYNEVMMQGVVKDFGKHMGNMQKFGDRMPNYIFKSMESTKGYMDSVVRGWKDDGIVDDVEYGAWRNLIQYGDLKSLEKIEQRQDALAMKQMNVLDSRVNENISKYNQLKVHLENQYIDVDTRELLSGEKGMSLFQEGGPFDEDDATQRITRDMILTDDEYNRASPGMKQAHNLASKLFSDTEILASNLAAEIERDNAILVQRGFKSPADMYGFEPYKSQEQLIYENMEASKQAKIKQIINLGPDSDAILLESVQGSNERNVFLEDVLMQGSENLNKQGVSDVQWAKEIHSNKDYSDEFYQGLANYINSLKATYNHKGPDEWKKHYDVNEWGPLEGNLLQVEEAPVQTQTTERAVQPEAPASDVIGEWWNKFDNTTVRIIEGAKKLTENLSEARNKNKSKLQIDGIKGRLQNLNKELAKKGVRVNELGEVIDITGKMVSEEEFKAIQKEKKGQGKAPASKGEEGPPANKLKRAHYYLDRNWKQDDTIPDIAWNKALGEREGTFSSAKEKRQLIANYLEERFPEDPQAGIRQLINSGEWTEEEINALLNWDETSEKLGELIEAGVGI